MLFRARARGQRPLHFEARPSQTRRGLLAVGHLGPNTPFMCKKSMEKGHYILSSLRPSIFLLKKYINIKYFCSGIYRRALGICLCSPRGDPSLQRTDSRRTNKLKANGPPKFREANCQFCSPKTFFADIVRIPCLKLVWIQISTLDFNGDYSHAGGSGSLYSGNVCLQILAQPHLTRPFC